MRAGLAKRVVQHQPLLRVRTSGLDKISYVPYLFFMFVTSPPCAPAGLAWPRPPSCLVAARLEEPPEGARITVAGLVILRQRPGTAKGVIFLTLEDETGIVNVIVWRKLYERFRRAVISARMLRVTGRLQRAHSVTHVIAEQIEDISDMLDLLLRGPD